MKPKSGKLRFLLILQALFKYTDKDHRLNMVKLNEYLRPYNLDGESKILQDAVTALREFGFDVKQEGCRGNRGVWIENCLMPEDMLKQLVFSLDTNPYLTWEQKDEYLNALKPFVTVYQEPILHSIGEMKYSADEHTCALYHLIAQAIVQKKRIRIALRQVRIVGLGTVETYESKWKSVFTPKCVCERDKRLYLIGYNHRYKKVQAVDFREIAAVEFAQKHTVNGIEGVWDLLDDICPEDYLPQKHNRVIYRGSAEICCKRMHLPLLAKRFPGKCRILRKNVKTRELHVLLEADITSRDLEWFVNIPDRKIKIEGPTALKDAVRVYYESLCGELLC